MTLNPYKHTGDQAPYYDDFDSTKNYLRILYNPAKGVQGRELTQSQTILQNQVAALGGYTFKDGSLVQGGKISFTYKQPSIKANALDKNGIALDTSTLVGHKFTGSVSGQMIIVTGIIPSTRYLLFSYLGSSISSSSETFNGYDNASLNFVSESNSVTNSFCAAVSEGILFVDGYFCYIPKQNFTIQTNALTTEKYHIGFSLDRNYITTVEDSTLYDPAAGSYNYNAPGADRYQIQVNLFGYKDGDPLVTTEILSNYIPQVIVDAEKIILDQTTDPNSTLMDAIARRTYEESGSYNVSGWDVSVSDNADNSKLNVSVAPGLGYIKGYRIQNLESSTITVDKPRTALTKTYTSQYIPYDSYSYALVDDITGAISGKAVPNYPKAETVELMSGLNGTGNILGECKFTNMYKSGNKVLLFFRETSAVQNAFPGAKSIRSKTNPTLYYVNLSLDTNSRATFVSSKVLPIISTPYTLVKSVTSGKVNYEETRSYIVVSEASGNIMNLSEADTTLDFPTYAGLIAVYATSTGTHLNINNLALVPNNSGGVSTAVLSGGSISNSTSYTVVLRVKRTLMTTRTKVAAQYIKAVSVASGTNVVTLDHEDVLDIVSIVQTNNTTGNTPANLKDYLTFNNGQSLYTYNPGSVSGFTSLSSSFRATPAATTNYTITYRYYNHTGSGPFVSNSYVTAGNATFLSDIADLYKAIPTFVDGTSIYNLKQCIDFRVKASELSASGSYYPCFGTELNYECDIYLPRIDTVWVNSVGTFGITMGIPSEQPQVPNIPSEVFAIGNLVYKPYLLNTKNNTEILDVKFKRFTMEDIGTLERRIDNVEDVVALSQLEQSAVNMKIVDVNGNDRYKSGIFTDSFSTWDNSNYSNSEFTCSIDEIEQSIRAPYSAKNIDFVYNNSASTTSKLNTVLVTLPYSTTVYTQNMYVSESMNVQKLLFYVWTGSLKLTPSVDNWVNDLGNIIVKVDYTDIPKPPTTFRSWSNTSISNGWLRNVTTVTTTSQTTTYADGGWALNSSNNINKSVVDQYLRVRSVSYTCSNLRPGITVTGTIDGIPLVLSNSVPDANGNLSGTFTIPANIPVGTKLVKFTDANKSSIASAYYIGSGITIWRETSLGYIRQWFPVVASSETSSSTITSTRRGSDGDSGGRGSSDPLAQSFYVSETDGIFIDSIDIYFKAKDASIPVEVYIVETDNGYPTQNMLPFARKQIHPSTITLGINTATNFKFPEPIYLQGNREYAFIVKSSSYQYEIYTSTLGKTDLNTGVGIAEQPVLGSLFSSQNASTWTAEQLSDIKFRIHNCLFTTNTLSSTIFDIPLQSSDWEVAMQTITSNTFVPGNTLVEYYYKWKNDGSWTKFENNSDIFNTTIQTLTSSGQVPLSIKIAMKSTNSFVSPIIDTEQTYAIFAQNTLTDRSSDAPYLYNSGVYVSNEVSLTHPATDIRVVLDMIAPGYSDADIYFQTYDYKPIYVTHATNGLCTESSSGTALIGQTCQLYYYNNSTKVLEPKSKVIVTGYDTVTKKIFMRSVGAPDEFVPIQGGDSTQTIYTGISANYTALILMPIFSTVNISAVAWTATSFTAGTYVTYSNSIWKARTAAIAANVPSELSIVWEKIIAIKTVTIVTPDTTVTWRKMTKGGINSSIDTQHNFVEYSFSPEVVVESEFSHFAIKIDMKSRNKVDIPRIKNLRAIATV